MRRTLSILASLALVGVLVSAPAPAFAAQPPPLPVSDVPDLPSRMARIFGTGSPIGDKAVIDYYRVQEALRRVMMDPNTTQAMRDAALKGAGSIPKPIAPPVTWSRLAAGSAGGLAPMIAGGVGWAIGNGMLHTYAHNSGMTYDELACGGGPIYLGVSSVFTLGMYGPNCTATVLTPNNDAVSTVDMSLGGTVVASNIRAFTYTTNTYLCASNIKAEYVDGFDGNISLQVKVASGAWTGASWLLLPAGSPFGAACATGQYRGPGDSTASASRPTAVLRLFNTSTSQTVTTSAQSSADPLRTPRCKIKNGTDVFTGEGTPYRESTGGIPVSADALGCTGAWEDFVSSPGRGPDLVPDEITVESVQEGGTVHEVSKQTMPEYTPDQTKGLTAPSTASGLQLLKVVNDQTDSCMTWAADCVDWWTQTSNGTIPGVYRCMFAGEAVALAECGIYRYTFDVKTSTPTITNPQNGEQVEWATGPAVGPTPGGSTAPGVSTGASCMSAWSSVMNPIEWVMHPVVCSFVPSPQKMAEHQTKMDTAWRNSTPGKLGIAVAGVSPALAALADGGCGGVILPVPKVGAGWSVTTENRAFLPACPGDFFAPWAPPVKFFITSAIVIAGLFGIKRLLDRFVGNS